MKKLLLRITLLAVSTLLCLAVFELVISRFYYSDVQEIHDKEFDETLGWRLKPGVYRVKAPHAFAKHDVLVNQLGLRGDEVAPSPAPGKQRIVVLGDSFVFGKAVPGDETFVSVMEERLAAVDAGFEVVNAGVPAYGNAQELLLMRRLLGEDIAADVYVMTIFANDILDNSRLSYRDFSINRVAPLLRVSEGGELELSERPEQEPAEASPNFASARRGIALPRTLQVLWLAIESFVQTQPALVRMAGRMGLGIDFPYVPTVVKGWYHDPVLEDGVPLLRAILRSARDEAARRDAVFVVTFVPPMLQVYLDTYEGMLERSFGHHAGVRGFLDDPGKPQRLVGELCEELAIPYLDLLPILRSRNGEEFYIPRDGHFNRAGHATVAAALADFVVDARRESRGPVAGAPRP